MTTGEHLFCRVLAADILLAVTRLLLGGSALEAIIIIAVLQAGILLAIGAVAGAVHKLAEEASGRQNGLPPDTTILFMDVGIYIIL